MVRHRAAWHLENAWHNIQPRKLAASCCFYECNDHCWIPKPHRCCCISTGQVVDKASGGETHCNPHGVHRWQSLGHTCRWYYQLLVVLRPCWSNMVFQYTCAAAARSPPLLTWVGEMKILPGSGSDMFLPFHKSPASEPAAMRSSHQ